MHFFFCYINSGHNSTVQIKYKDLAIKTYFVDVLSNI